MRSATIEQLRKQVERLSQEKERLREAMERLRKELEAALRANKRQAAPHSRGRLQGSPKRPGRKPRRDYGRPACHLIPARVDEQIEVPCDDTFGSSPPPYRSDARACAEQSLPGLEPRWIRSSPRPQSGQQETLSKGSQQAAERWLFTFRDCPGLAATNHAASGRFRGW